jgi:heme a synthase
VATTPALYNFEPLLWMLAAASALGGLPLLWNWWRHRGDAPAVRLRALTLLTLFLTFDLVVFGAFTRLTDSGLGCPDWPGCYGSATPLGAHADIQAAQSAMPTGPVTHGKAWIEMVHRYLAAGVGVLILGLAAGSWRAHLKGDAAVSPWWATVTLVAVCLQGAFGALTVTMKLYPAIVTLHLLTGLALMALLAVQAQAYGRERLILPAVLRVALWPLAALVVMQVALGGWVSTNYAVLACTDFPTCHGQWWPAMDFEHGFAIRRELGAGKDGGFLPFSALTAIHMTHRLGAAVVLTGLLALGAWLHALGRADTRRWAFALWGAGAWQLASGLGNVVLGWPLVAALAHTAGSAVLVTLFAVMLARAGHAGRDS